jgi:lysophospholipase L1-like esterase
MGQGFPRTLHWRPAKSGPSTARFPKVLTVGARWLAGLVVLSLVAVAAIAVALQVTPLQTVTVAGQVIKVGSTAPGLTFSGPGEIDMFGQSLPTNLQFTGPVRPRLQLAQITINSELTNFVEGSKPSRVEHILGSRLADGWAHYFIWESVIAGAGALLLVGALAGWRRVPHRTTFKLLAAGLLIAEAVNVAAILVTAHKAQGGLRQVTSLNQLVGSTPLKPPKLGKKKPAQAFSGVQAVVLGDSTAAGAGLYPVSGGSSFDRACDRSSDAYAQDLASVNSWHVLNLSCSDATIRHGILGSQHRGGKTLRPQLATAERVQAAKVVIVSVGANDLGWAQMLGYCAVAPRCDDKATTAYFQQQLASFSKEYLDLLSRLAALPAHPHVIINRYYNPFGTDPACLREVGYTPAKLLTITDRLNALNTVLQKGATQFGFSSPQPDFAGHQLCSAQPYVQGLGSAAPFHPTALGQLAIALADQAALRGQG